MSSGSYYEEEMSSGGHRRLTAFILWPFSPSKKSLFLLTMGLAGRIRFFRNVLRMTMHHKNAASAAAVPGLDDKTARTGTDHVLDILHLVLIPDRTDQRGDRHTGLCRQSLRQELVIHHRIVTARIVLHDVIMIAPVHGEHPRAGKSGRRCKLFQDLSEHGSTRGRKRFSSERR